MGLFDFFKKDKQDTPSADQSVQNDNEQQEETIKYKTKLTAREITTNPKTIQEIVDKMVTEDPFKNYYDGKTDAHFGPSSNRAYEYEVITTMNVDLVAEGKNNLQIYIEGTLLGDIPQKKAREINQYREKDILTAYVFVTGGRYKEYSEETNDVQEGTAPYGLDIFIQFT